MKILLVSPYHGGSHRAWATGFQQYSAHEVTLLTLPARFWKWRMHGGAVTLARRFLESDLQPDLLLTTDMLDLTTFLALSRSQIGDVPAIVYMHENQLTYPLPADGGTGPMRRQLGERDQHYAFVNYASMLAADGVVFNSQYHLQSFFAELPRFLKHFPEYNELGSVAKLREKSKVLPVGVDFQRLGQAPHNQRTATASPLIMWNQRWEYDKNPDAFFEALFALADAGAVFRVALCGQEYGKRPFSFQHAIKRLSEQIVHIGFAEPAVYKQLLWEADITISTAHHEFFGISILETIYAQTLPLLPNRLSYPELIPPEFHPACLYADYDDLKHRLLHALEHPGAAKETAVKLATAVSRYDWTEIGTDYDAFFTRFVR